jgi:Icc-related predicted phosphoesterase
VWVLSGDFFPNLTRGDREIETRYQNRWFAQNAFAIKQLLRGAPVLFVPGNHDYADLGTCFRREYMKAWEITPTGFEFHGVRWAGFGHIPFIAGEWDRETTTMQLSILTRRTLEVGNPDILVTHAPPDGILNGNYAGIGPLASALTYSDHKVKVHLFGHAHEDGGLQIEHMGIRFVNSAMTAQVINFP